jgi:hypothetical protein
MGLVARCLRPEAGVTFGLALFATDERLLAGAVEAGVTSVVVDWEWEGKHERQAAADTEVNRHTVADLRRVRRLTDARLVCRLNRLSAGTPAEVEAAVAEGADELLLPMVRSAGEVEEALALVDGRAALGILVETTAAVDAAEALAALPLACVYVGLNDLAIERGTPTIFAPLADGTLDRLRAAFARIRFGFGGLTLPEAGAPLPCRLLIAELARLRCDFAFLRRSFYRDMAGRDPAVEVPRLLAALDAAFARTPDEEEQDRAELLAALDGVVQAAEPRSYAALA